MTGSAQVAPLADSRAGFIEGLKWTAAALMLLEHWCRYVIGDCPPIVYLLGRLVFPFFVFALALALRESSWPTVRRVIVRLFVWAVITQALRVLSIGDAVPFLNVLFTFGLGVLLVHALSCNKLAWSVLVILAVTLALAPFCEYGIIGVAFVASCVMLARTKRPPPLLLAVAALSLIGLAVPNGTYFAIAALPAAWLLDRAGFGVPRVRGFFYWLYAGQWPVIALAGRVLG